jgi:type I restriction enzyme S subunit
MHWKTIPFEKSIQKITYTAKIPKKQFLENGTFPIVSQEADYINGYWNNEGDVFKVPSPVVIFGDHTKVIKHIDFDFVLGADGVKILFPIKELESKFLAYFLESCDIEDLGYARHYRLLKEFSVPLPTLPEQKRIVALLDIVFADLEQTRAKTEQNLKNARELFDSYLQQVFSQEGDIKSTELGEIVDVLTDYHANGSYKVLKQNVELSEEEDFAWMVRSTDFEKKFKNNKRYISEHAYNYLTKSKLFGGEIIMSKIGNAGKVYLMPATDRACSLAMNLFLIRLDATKANNEYVYRYLNSSSGKAQIAPRLKGAATQTITKDNVRSLLIPLPSLLTQKENIVALQKLEIETKALETLYLKKLNKIEELKKSILHKAFSGELSKASM